MARVKRTSLNLDFDLVEQARQVLGTTGTTETVRRALEDVVRRRALTELARWHPDIDDIERFRDEVWGD